MVGASSGKTIVQNRFVGPAPSMGGEPPGVRGALLSRHPAGRRPGCWAWWSGAVGQRLFTGQPAFGVGVADQADPGSGRVTAHADMWTARPHHGQAGAGMSDDRVPPPPLIRPMYPNLTAGLLGIGAMTVLAACDDSTEKTNGTAVWMRMP